MPAEPALIAGQHTIAMHMPADKTVLSAGQYSNAMHLPVDEAAPSVAAVDEGRDDPAEPELSLKAEASQLSRLAFPIMTVSMLQFLMVMVDMGMVGRLGTQELAASALANTFFNCLQHPVVGCATALDTLLATSWGAEQHAAFGQWAKAASPSLPERLLGGSYQEFSRTLRLLR
jgi:hypothetical protein